MPQTNYFIKQFINETRKYQDAKHENYLLLDKITRENDHQILIDYVKWLTARIGRMHRDIEFEQSWHGQDLADEIDRQIDELSQRLEATKKDNEMERLHNLIELAELNKDLQLAEVA
jgi:hypothetical protein